MNVDDAYPIGKKIITGMDDQSVAKYTFKRSDQVVTLAARGLEKRDAVENGSYVSIQTEVLFQRYVSASKWIDYNVDVFEYELCGHPTALFERPGVMRKPVKCALADEIAKKTGVIDEDFHETTEQSIIINYICF